VDTQPRHTPQVLLVDDNPTNLQVLYQTLDGQGYRLLAARSGKDALAIAQRVGPDLILLDVMMPKLDGFELTRRLRAEEATSRMPIILLTARAQDTDVGQGFEAGADDYLRKPFSPQELRTRVQAILGRR
jgi:DNA-binding response OmpR family regulator